jgi:hypothetical protein
MAQPQPEKRSTRRFALDLPVVVNFHDDGTHQVTGRTRDVSSRGVFFYLSSEISEGASVEFVMTLPSEITFANSIGVHCVGKVVRVEKTASGQGIAVAIEKYDI